MDPKVRDLSNIWSCLQTFLSPCGCLPDSIDASFRTNLQFSHFFIILHGLEMYGWRLKSYCLFQQTYQRNFGGSRNADRVGQIDSLQNTTTNRRTETTSSLPCRASIFYCLSDRASEWEPWRNPQNPVTHEQTPNLSLQSVPNTHLFL